jgi:hypothetical protein
MKKVNQIHAVEKEDIKPDTLHRKREPYVGAGSGTRRERKNSGDSRQPALAKGQKSDDHGLRSQFTAGSLNTICRFRSVEIFLDESQYGFKQRLTRKVILICYR